MPVSEVIGPYAEQAELAEKARKEMEERQQAAGAIKAKQDRLVNLFFGKTGLSKSPKSEYSNPFRATYHGVEISKEGIEALLKFFDTDHAERKYGV